LHPWLEAGFEGAITRMQGTSEYEPEDHSMVIP
jgi:hypothetical protein